MEFRSPPELSTFFSQTPASRKKLTFSQGASHFRQRLALSLLSSRPIKIEEIRSASDLAVGLQPWELSFIQLINQISNGTKIKISETGTEIYCSPGVLTGGEFAFDSDSSRPLSYYLEPLLLLAPFCKAPLSVTLRGRLQNQSGYNSVYKIKYSALPILAAFGVKAELEVISRSNEVSTIKFTCSIRRQLITLRNQFNSDCGKVKKIRGLAYGFRVAPQLLNRVVGAAKGAFVPFLSDVYITTDQVKRSKSKEAGYGLVLWGTTTKGVVYTEDGFLGPKSGGEDVEEGGAGLPALVGRKLDEDAPRKRKFDIFNEENPEAELQDAKSGKNSKKTPKALLEEARGSPETPEELGVTVARQLLTQFRTQACIDPVFQWLILGLMALSPRDVSSVSFGPLTPFTVQYLRDLRLYFGVMFRVEEQGAGSRAGGDEEEDEGPKKKAKLFKLSCLGSGYINLNKTMI